MLNLSEKCNYNSNLVTRFQKDFRVWISESVVGYTFELFCLSIVGYCTWATHAGIHRRNVNNTTIAPQCPDEREMFQSLYGTLSSEFHSNFLHYDANFRIATESLNRHGTT